MNETLQVIASGLGIVGAVYVILEKTFGGGNALAKMFANLKAEVTKDMSDLRTAVFERVDRYESNAAAGFDRVTANLHLIDKGFDALRIKVLEDFTKYVQKDDNRLMYVDFARNIERQFDDVKKQLEEGGKRMARIEDLVGSLRADGG